MAKKDGFGFNKANRNAARAADREEKEEIKPLELPFPHVMIPFDFGFFGIGAELTPVKKPEDEESS